MPIKKTNKAKFKNDVTVEGLFYDCALEEKVTGPNSKVPGTNYIAGTVDVVTNDEYTNVVTIHYSYVATTDTKYPMLKKMMDGEVPSFLKDGAEAALAVRILGSIEVNEFYTDRTLDENNQPTLASGKRIRGGPIFTISRKDFDPSMAKRSLFRADMVITSAQYKEANEEKGWPEKVTIKGWIFDYRESAYPVSFTVLHPSAISFFQGLDISGRNPAFTEIHGYVVSMTTKVQREIEGAFSTEIVEYTQQSKDWVVNFCLKEDQWYPFDDEEDSLLGPTIMKEKMKQREEYLAELKNRYDERQRAKTSPATPTVKSSGLDFSF